MELTLISIEFFFFRHSENEEIRRFVGISFQKVLGSVGCLSLSNKKPCVSWVHKIFKWESDVPFLSHVGGHIQIYNCYSYQQNLY